MLVINKDIFGKRENIQLYGDDRDTELLTKIVLLEDEVISNYLFDTVISYQQSLMMEDFLKSEIESKKEDIKYALEQIEKLKARKASLQAQKNAENTLLNIMKDATETTKGLMNCVKQVGFMAFNAAHALVTLDSDAFLQSLVSGIKGIGGSLLDVVLSQLKFVWNRFTDITTHLARALADLGLECVGEGLLGLGKFVIKMIGVICSDMGQKVLSVGLPVVAAIAAGVGSGGAGAVAGTKAGSALAGQIAMGCALANIGGIALTLQMGTFEQELKRMDEKEVDAQIKRVQNIIKEIEREAEMTAVEILNERKRQDCYEFKTSLVLGCLAFYESLFYEYPGLTPQTAVRVYLNSVGKDAFDKIMHSNVVPYYEIKDLLGVLVKAANDKFSGEVRCDKLEPGFARFLSEIHGVSDTTYCAYIGRSQIDALKEDYESIFEFDSNAESMSLRDFLNQYGDAINQKAREIATGKAFLYKDLLDIKNASELNQMLRYKNIDYKKIFPQDLSFYSESEIKAQGKSRSRKIILWTLFVSGSMFAAWKIYDNIKRVQEGEEE